MRKVALALAGLTFLAAPNAAHALTIGPGASCPPGSAIGSMTNVTLRPASGATAVASPTLQQTFTLVPPPGYEPGNNTSVDLEVWDSQGKLVDEEEMSWNSTTFSDDINADSVTQAQIDDSPNGLAPWYEVPGTYRWTAAQPYVTESYDSSTLSPVYTCKDLLGPLMTFNVTPPPLRTAAIAARWNIVIGPHANEHRRCSMVTSWRANCSLRWQRNNASYIATGTLTNGVGFSGPLFGDTADFWVYNLAGTRIYRGRRRAFHWHGQYGPPNA